MIALEIDTTPKTDYRTGLIALKNTGWSAPQDSTMKKTFLQMALLSTLVTMPLLAGAAMRSSEAEATVVAMLGAGASSTEIIEALVEDGRSLRDATALAVGVANGDHRIDLAKTGICAASDTTQAEKVGRAAIAVTSEAALIDNIEGAIGAYAAGMCDPVKNKKLPPSGYETSTTPSGGGEVSPSR